MSQNESQTAATEENDKRIQEIEDSQNLDDSTKEQWKSAMGSWTTNDFVYDDETIISLLSDEKLLTVDSYFDKQCTANDGVNFTGTTTRTEKIATRNTKTNLNGQEIDDRY
jgi:hypothetical protein